MDTSKVRTDVKGLIKMNTRLSSELNGRNIKETNNTGNK